jgi:hypothetical protein
MLTLHLPFVWLSAMTLAAVLFQMMFIEQELDYNRQRFDIERFFVGQLFHLRQHLRSFDSKEPNNKARMPEGK